MASLSPPDRMLAGHAQGRRRGRPRRPRPHEHRHGPEEATNGKDKRQGCKREGQRMQTARADVRKKQRPTTRRRRRRRLGARLARGGRRRRDDSFRLLGRRGCGRRAGGRGLSTKGRSSGARPERRGVLPLRRFGSQGRCGLCFGGGASSGPSDGLFPVCKTPISAGGADARGVFEAVYGVGAVRRGESVVLRPVQRSQTCGKVDQTLEAAKCPRLRSQKVRAAPFG
mmetsp:Transcript_26741/g.92020  ORF Transcript_26741/g.92020 Transcript_26741/m.92020 type:complete len:227 (-) Transcript_26741:409-1089(-)